MHDLLAHLTSLGVLQTSDIIAAFKEIDRKDFVLPEHQDAAYEDSPLPIGHGQTISQPYTVAFMLELLQAKSGEKILDVGSGSAWTTALLAHIVGQKGHVYGTEIIPELVAFGRQNLKKYELPQVKIIQAGKKLGLPQKMPFDKILVSAMAETLPKQLLEQLKSGGVMVIPVDGNVFKIRKISETEVESQKFEGFAFVPLVD